MSHELWDVPVKFPSNQSIESCFIHASSIIPRSSRIHWKLPGKTLPERARLLIDLAHPDDPWIGDFFLRVFHGDFNGFSWLFRGHLMVIYWWFMVILWWFMVVSMGIYYPVVNGGSDKRRSVWGTHIPYIFPMKTGEPKSYLEFPNHLIVNPLLVETNQIHLRVFSILF